MACSEYKKREHKRSFLYFSISPARYNGYLHGMNGELKRNILSSLSGSHKRRVRLSDKDEALGRRDWSSRGSKWKYFFSSAVQGSLNELH